MLNKFNKHLNKIFSSYKKNNKIMEFKEELLGSLMDRYNEFKEEGLSDEESYDKSLIILDGIKDTIATLEEEYREDIPKKNNTSRYLLASAAYWIIIVLAFFALTFTDLSKTWLVFIAGALLYGIFVSLILFSISKKKGMNILSRTNIFSTIMCIITAVYLIWSILSDKWVYSWIIFIVGLLIWYIIDIIVKIKNTKGYKLKVYDVIIVTVLITLIIYFLISFIYTAWYKSWIIFIIMSFFIIIELMIFIRKK